MKFLFLRGSLRASVFLAFMFVASASSAQTSLIFERAKIRIDATLSAKEIKENAEPRPSISYDIELRPESALNLESIHTLNLLTPTTGVMITLDAPSIVSLPFMKVYTPIDVLLVAEDGSVIQIMPQLVLGELNQTIQARSPVKALLFLKSDEAKSRSIRPRDVVAGSMFTPAPAMQE